MNTQKKSLNQSSETPEGPLENPVEQQRTDILKLTRTMVGHSVQKHLGSHSGIDLCNLGIADALGLDGASSDYTGSCTLLAYKNGKVVARWSPPYQDRIAGWYAADSDGADFEALLMEDVYFDEEWKQKRDAEEARLTGVRAELVRYDEEMRNEIAFRLQQHQGPWYRVDEGKDCIKGSYFFASREEAEAALNGQGYFKESDLWNGITEIYLDHDRAPSLEMVWSDDNTEFVGFYEYVDSY